MSHDNGHDHDQERAIDLKLLLDDSSTPGHDLVSEAGMIDLKMLLDDSSTPDQTMTNAKKRKTTDQTITNAKTMTSAKTTDQMRASANTTDGPMTQARTNAKATLATTVADQTPKTQLCSLMTQDLFEMLE